MNETKSKFGKGVESDKTYSKGTLGISGVLERIENLLESYSLSCSTIDGLPYNSVGLWERGKRNRK